MKAACIAMAGSFSLLIVSASEARDLFVNHEIGNDVHGGLSADAPFQTIKAALRICGPGDVIHLAKTATPYHEGIEIANNQSGLPGQPITIDGHGATLSGCTPLRAEEWTDLGDGLYRNSRLLPDLFPLGQPVNETLLRRFFFLFNGKMVRMGRNGKGDCAPLPKPSDLKAGEWTHDQDGFYLKIDPSKALSGERVEYPDLGNGFRTSDGHCEFLVVRNLIVTHFWNDGFNINGNTVNTRFENIEAIECGDDGMSAHTSSRIEVDGFISRGNTTGICHVQGSHSSSRRLVLENNCAFEVLLSGSGIHEISDSVILPSRHLTRVVRLSSEQAEEGKGCRLHMENVLIDGDHCKEAHDKEESRRLGREFTVEILGKCHWSGRRVTLLSVGLTSKWPAPGVSEVTLFQSIMAGQVKPEIDLLPTTIWQANDNAYDLATIAVGGTRYTPSQWEEYRRATGQDQASSWGAPDKSELRGVDSSKLPVFSGN